MKDLVDKMYLDFRNLFYKKKIYKDYKCAFKIPASSEQLEKAQNQKVLNDLLNFYNKTGGFEVSWDFERKNDLIGRMKIIDIKYVIESWEDKLYYEGDDEKLKYFRPLDIFTEEACVGIVLDESGDKNIYYHTFGESKLYPLNLDFKGYFEMAIEARVFLYWQLYIVEKVNGKLNVRVDFPVNIKKVLPDFNLEAFDAKFESLRLSKRS